MSVGLVRVIAGCLVSLGLAGCGVWSGSVTRVYAGQEVEERYITPDAYAHYAQAAILEAAGRDRDAMLEYTRAAEEDSDSVDIWTRLGAVHCRLGSKKSDLMFQLAEDLDKDFAPLLRERARCALSRGDARSALGWAERAVALDPDDEASSLAVAEALRKSGRIADSRRWLVGLLARDPSSRRGRQALTDLDAPSETGTSARAHPSSDQTLPELDRAIARGDATTAGTLARALGLSAAGLALRAAALGRPDLARGQAERVLAADPDDADAFVAALVAASLERDDARASELLARLGSEPMSPSPLAIRLFGELLARRIGPAAARAWRESWAPLPEPRDPLEAKVEARTKTF